MATNEHRVYRVHCPGCAAIKEGVSPRIGADVLQVKILFESHAAWPYGSNVVNMTCECGQSLRPPRPLTLEH